MTLTKRGKTYHLDTALGERRIRCTLGVRDPKAAERLANRVQFALSDGPKSEVWPSLKQVLPPASYQRLTLGLGLTAEPITVLDFEETFYDSLDRRKTMGELADRSYDLYTSVAKRFFDWLHEKGVRKMDDITKSVIENWLMGRKGLSKNTRITEMRVLQIIFNLAVEEGIIKVSPLKDIRKIKEDEPNPVPFTAEEILRMEEVEKDPRTDLVYKLFRHTGMRRSDVADLQWKAVDWDTKTIRWRAKKNRKQVTIPLVPALYEALKREYKPEGGTILETGGTDQIYRTIKGIGKAAKVEDCHPHRFRHTMATELLAKGATLYDVAKILGDTPATVDKYYGAYTAQQRERIRDMMIGEAS